MGALAFELKRQMGPPFASVTRDGLELLLAGPGSSARRPMPDGSEPAPGGTQVVVEDPSGNPIEVFQAASARALHPSS